jgi:hypothetical protein
LPIADGRLLKAESWLLMARQDENALLIQGKGCGSRDMLENKGFSDGMSKFRKLLSR